MKRFFSLLAVVIYSLQSLAQTTCIELRDRSQAAINAIGLYESNGNPTEKDFDQLTLAYTNFRDYAIGKAATETDYDIKTLLQVYALQNATHYLVVASRLNKADLAWKEMKYCYDHIYSVINYKNLKDRKDNWVACTLPQSKKLEIVENEYHDICTEFICYSCNIIFHANKDAVAATIFAKAGFKGMLTHGNLLHRTAGDIFLTRFDKGQQDDTTWLAAYKFLLTNNELQSFGSISSDLANMTTSKALNIIVNPALAARSGSPPLKDVDEYSKLSLRYDNLYGYLAQDSAFGFSQKFEVLRIALADYLTEMKSIRIDNHSFWHLPALYQVLDAGYETGDGYSVRKPMESILHSGNTELLRLLAQVYELYGEHCYGYYPAIEKAHYYYSAYVCYRAIGDTKNANKAFKNIPNSMLANKKSLGYRKLDD